MFQGLEAYLKKESDRKAILKTYKQSLKKKIPVKHTIRSRLVRLVIQREKDKSLKNVSEDDTLQKFV